MTEKRYSTMTTYYIHHDDALCDHVHRLAAAEAERTRVPVDVVFVDEGWARTFLPDGDWVDGDGDAAADDADAADYETLYYGQTPYGRLVT